MSRMRKSVTNNKAVPRRKLTKGFTPNNANSNIMQSPTWVLDGPTD
jgi:hypothetical protein